MKMLVVDDEAIVLKSCRMVLEAEGCEVISAASVDEALAILEQQAPELLLIDVKMPIHNGMYLMRRVKENQPHIPVIVMSGYATAETIQEAEDLGAAAFLPKPFTPDELAEVIKTVLTTIKGK
jgi:DNA-binding NtrC family response regulator